MIVYDKNIFSDSKREIDGNGFLRVDLSNITKTQVAPYLGREIPNWKEFGLEADKIYYVLRPEEELKKAVPTFNNLPLTREHIEVDVENVPKDKIVGSLGDRAEYQTPYIRNSLIVYDKKDIDMIMSGKKKELSCGYRYTPVREDGEFNGQHYDFRMTDIIGNHVALVKEGRAGHDVMVSDTIEKVKEKFMNLFKKKPLAEDEFKESEHPRDDDGKFTSKGGSGSSIKEGGIARVGNVWVSVKKIDGGNAVVSPIYKEDVEKGRFGEEEMVRLKDLITEEEIHKKEKEKDYMKSGSTKSEKLKSLEEDLVEANKRFEAFKKEPQTEENRNDRFMAAKEVEMLQKAIEHEQRLSEGSEKKEESSGNEIKKPNSNKSVRIVKNGNAYMASYGQSIKQGVPDEEYKPFQVLESKGFASENAAKKWANKVLELEMANDEIPEKQDEPKKAGEENALNNGENKVEEKSKEEILVEDKCSAKDEEKDLKGKEKEAFAEGVNFGEKKEKEEPKKLDSEHESEGEKKALKKEKEAEDEDEEKKDEKKDEKKAEDKCAMDMAMDIDSIKAEAREEGRQEAIADYKAREVARKAVRKMVGDVDVFAFDSADEIYKFACEKAGVDLTDVACYKDVFKGLSARKGGLAMDASPVSGSNEECFKDIRLY